MNNGIDLLSYTLGKKKGGTTPTGEIDITQNGITNVSGYATANVQVPEKQLEEKSVTISSNTTTLIEPTQGKDGMSSVSVTTNIPQPSGKITITENGTDIDVSSYASADVSVSGGVWKVPNGTKFKGSSFSSISGIDTSEVTTMYEFFSGCSNLTAIPNLDFHLVTNLNNAFEYCSNLTNVDFSNSQFSTNIYNMSGMFSSCTSLEEADLSGIGQLNAQVNFSNMFVGCTSLKKVNLSNLAYSNYNSFGRMFQNCTSLEELDISSMIMPGSWFSNMFTGVPANCLILVKDQTAKDWFTTNWSNLTNVQIKSEYIANQGA